MRELSQIELCLWFFPPTTTEGARAAMLETEMRTPKCLWSLPSALLSWSGSAAGWSCSPGSAQTLPPGEPETHRSSSQFSSPKRRISAAISSVQPVPGNVCCVNGAEKTTLLSKGQMGRTHYGNACQQQTAFVERRVGQKFPSN